MEEGSEKSCGEEGTGIESHADETDASGGCAVSDGREYADERGVGES